MKYNEVQVSLEKLLQSLWTATPLSFENVEFNSSIYNEFVQVNVVMGEGSKRAMQNCYRVVGLLILTVYVRPAVGLTQALTYADQLTSVLTSREVVATPPSAAPVVQLKTPDLYKGTKEENGWVKVQLSFPFHYDLEI